MTAVVIDLDAHRRARGAESLACCWGIGDGARCGQTDGTVMYPAGPLCPEHTPARRVGRPEPRDVLADWQARHHAEQAEQEVTA